MSYKSQTVTAVVITRNDAATLERCLSSLHWVDELVVLDCGSADGSLAIARLFTEKVQFHPSNNLTVLRRDAMAMATCDWILLVEPDEWVEEMLRHEIDGALLNTAANIQGYLVPRKLKFQGQWIMHGEGPPEAVLRLVRRKGNWHVAEDWDAALRVDGNPATVIGRLDRALGYAPYATVEDLFADVNRASTLEAYRHLAAEGVNSGALSVWSMLWRAKWTAFRHYILRGSFRDGFTGLMMAMARMLADFLRMTKMRALTCKPVGQPL